MKTVFLALTLLTAGRIQAQCSPNAVNIHAFAINGTPYEIVKENLNWSDAAACAVSRGGKLAEINSQAEQDSIFIQVNNAGISSSATIAQDGGNASYLWIGGNDVASEGNWVWNGDNDNQSAQFWQGTSTGFAVNGLYSNWGDEPDNWNGQDGLGFAFTNWPYGVAGEWNDVFTTNALYYIIEYPNTLSVGEMQKETMEIYPNPASETITIRNCAPGTQIEIVNLAGAVVFAITGEAAVDISEFENGFYFVRMQTDDKLFEQIFVKQ